MRAFGQYCYGFRLSVPSRSVLAVRPRVVAPRRQAGPSLASGVRVQCQLNLVHSVSSYVYTEVYSLHLPIHFSTDYGVLLTRVPHLAGSSSKEEKRLGTRDENDWNRTTPGSHVFISWVSENTCLSNRLLQHYSFQRCFLAANLPSHAMP